MTGGWSPWPLPTDVAHGVRDVSSEASSYHTAIQGTSPKTGVRTGQPCYIHAVTRDEKRVLRSLQPSPRRARWTIPVRDRPLKRLERRCWRCPAEKHVMYVRNGGQLNATLITGMSIFNLSSQRRRIGGHVRGTALVHPNPLFSSTKCERRDGDLFLVLEALRRAHKMRTHTEEMQLR